MKDWDSKIHRALAHPIRRRIIECLLDKDHLSFSELLRDIPVADHGKLGFHMRALGGLVERDPSKNKYHLTDRGQLAGELIWNTRFIIEGGGRELPLEPTRYVRHLRSGDHAVLFYDREYIKQEVCLPFLEVGLSKGEAVVRLVSEHSLDSEIREIQRCGITADWFRRGAFAVMSADEWYMEKGRAKARIIIANWLTLLKEKRKAGFAGLRVASEADIFFDHAKTDELLRYEEALGRKLPPNLCGLCIYNTNMLDGKQVSHLEKWHGHSIFEHMAFRTA